MKSYGIGFKIIWNKEGGGRIDETSFNELEMVETGWVHEFYSWNSAYFGICLTFSIIQD